MILGIDISHWQPYLNWEKLIKFGNVRFMFAKCSDVVLSTGKDYKDPKFLKYVDDARKAGVITGSYHYFQPKFSASQQARNYFNQASKVYPDLPPVIDLETSGGQSNAVVKANVLAFCEKTKELWGKYPIIYSREELIKKFSLQDYIKNPNLYWKADYKSKPTGHPCAFLQYTEKLRIPGIAVNLDGDKWLGTETEFADFVQNNVQPEPEPTPEPLPEPFYKQGRVIVSKLNIRNTPDWQHNMVIGALHKGDIVDISKVYNVRWAEIEPGKYAAIRGEAGTFIERII
jgi:lysozyme